MMKNLYDELIKYTKKDYYPFHMPGHKRRMEGIDNPYSIDITEIFGFDNLHHAEGILQECQEKAAKLYGADETYYLINGSTAGILTAISACTSMGGKILMARNSHKAAYHGVFLRNLETVYTYPHYQPNFQINCGLNVKEIEQLLTTHEDIQAIFITSPTYEGIVSDVEGIGRLAHEYSIPLIVDEAHGAHFGFHTKFPTSSITLGADLVIQSLHKTMPSFTQTALLHVNGNLIDRKKVRKYLDIYQTSSPSYLLMAGMDRCITLIQESGKELFQKYVEHLQDFYERVASLEEVEYLSKEVVGSYGCVDFDLSKILFRIKDGKMSGNELSQRLREEFHLEMEMVTGDYVLAMTSPLDTKEGFSRLYEALFSINQEVKKRKQEDHGKPEAKRIQGFHMSLRRNQVRMKLSEVEEKEKETIVLEDSEGRICGEYIYLYPPGIPLVTPGEYLNHELLEDIKNYKDKGFVIEGLADLSGTYVDVIKI